MTLPVRRMGQMVLYDAVQAASRYGFSLFSLDDVDAALEHVVQLKYSQEVKLAGGDLGDTTISVTPYCAGHSLGGCFWRVVRETEDIVYAVDVNHRKEAHLMGTVLEQFPRPSVLITDSLNGLQGQQQDRKTRDRNFFAATLETMRAGGNVLLPVDPAGRVLELLYMLNRVWEKEKMGHVHNLVFLRLVFLFPGFRNCGMLFMTALTPDRPLVNLAFRPLRSAATRPHTHWPSPGVSSNG